MDVTLGIKLYRSFSLGGRGVLKGEKPRERDTPKGKRGASKGERRKPPRRKKKYYRGKGMFKGGS